MRSKLRALGISVILMSTSVYARTDYGTHWAKATIEKWQAIGMIKGYEDGSFRPNNPVTRAEFAALLGRVCQLKEREGVPTYIDLVENKKWYVEAVNQVNAANLMYIEGNYFLPDKPVTREEAVYALAKAFGIVEQEGMTSFLDDHQIAYWAKGAVKALKEQGYVGGNPGGDFNPKGTLTRAEWVTLLDRILATRESIQITHAGIWLGEEYITLPVRENKISLDVLSLSQSYRTTDELKGLCITTNLPGAYLSSAWGNLIAGERYTFKEAEQELGMLKEMAMIEGINGERVVKYVLSGEQLTIASLMQDYKVAQRVAQSLDITLKDQYELIRGIKHPNGQISTFVICFSFKASSQQEANQDATK